MFKETEEKKKEREKEREGKPFDRIRARNDWLARVAAQRKASEKEGAEEEDHKEEVEEDSGEKYEDVTEEAVTEQVESEYSVYHLIVASPGKSGSFLVDEEATRTNVTIVGHDIYSESQ